MTPPPSPGYEIDGLTSSISCLSLSRQKPQSFKKFLQLPTEIRLQVFEHLLSSPTEKRFPHPLLAVSKGVRNESAPLVFKNVTLNLWRGTPGKDVRECILYLSSSRSAAKNVRSIPWSELQRMSLAQYLPWLGTIFMEARFGNSFLITFLRIEFAVATSEPARVRVESYIPGPVNKDGITYTPFRSRVRSHMECSEKVRDRIVEMVAGFRKSRKVNIRWIEELIEGDQLEAICEVVREDYASGRKLDAFLRER